MRRFADYTWPLLGGVAAWLHCLVGDDRMARWLRTNHDGNYPLTVGTSSAMLEPWPP